MTAQRDWLILGCIDGKHEWVHEGGRPCPHAETDCAARGYVSQPVYRCARCGDYDYGEPGGPGAEAC